MFAFLKSIVLGAVLAFIVSLFIGSAGATGGPLNVRSYTIEEVQIFWSWPLFVIGTALWFGILLLME
jgi:hypothetical protein